MKIGVESDARARFCTCTLQDLWVACSAHSDSRHMHHVPSSPSQQGSRGVRQWQGPASFAHHRPVAPIHDRFHQNPIISAGPLSGQHDSNTAIRDAIWAADNVGALTLSTCPERE
jgi:hypothetical protein